MHIHNEERVVEKCIFIQKIEYLVDVPVLVTLAVYFFKSPYLNNGLSEINHSCMYLDPRYPVGLAFVS